MKLGAMQPYLFPYLGYFQLINMVDIYILCGDVQYRKQNWINRNRIICDRKQGKVYEFSFSVKKDSYQKTINEREYSSPKDDAEKLSQMVREAYYKCSHFDEAWPLLQDIINYKSANVGDFNTNAIRKIAEYIGITTKIVSTRDITDEAFWKSFHEVDKTERIINMCHYFGSSEYINAVGGIELYKREDFHNRGIELSFLEMQPISYNQETREFIPSLSIIDVLMCNSKEEIQKLLMQYTLR